ncbi:uncharacterized protein [Oscarella lobularis]|uniref:uncharacterized protein isoform X2 n=1 Tax=Oscarella lobularis TaxID=121494 RepID=UPI00331446A7
MGVGCSSHRSNKVQPFRINRPKSSSPCPPLPKTGIGIEDSDDYQSLFPFENLVFEGGGIKGLAYVGALKVLDDIGVLQNVKRYAGSSAGATCACLLAVGCTVEQLWEFLNQDIKKELQDHSCGLLSLLPNLVRRYGWNPGSRLLKWFGNVLREQTGNPDITFMDVYERYGKELCIVTTNLDYMTEEYLHPKTTPSMPIREAVRLSISIPIVFQSPTRRQYGEINYYTDGGLICNYPIHAFDGWWLSLQKKDGFMRRIRSLKSASLQYDRSERFKGRNAKSLGFLVFSQGETELMRSSFGERENGDVLERPNTKLARRRSKIRQEEEVDSAILDAVERLFQALTASDMNGSQFIEINELRFAFKSEIGGFSSEDARVLFGHENVEQAFIELDNDGDGKISFDELALFISRKGVNFNTYFLGYKRKAITNWRDFISSVHGALAINVKRLFVREKDLDRTVGIDTDYVESSDYDLETDDKLFLVKAGIRAAKAFLKDNLKNRRIENCNFPRGL